MLIFTSLRKIVGLIYFKFRKYHYQRRFHMRRPCTSPFMRFVIRTPNILELLPHPNIKYINPANFVSLQDTVIFGNLYVAATSTRYLKGAYFFFRLKLKSFEEFGLFIFSRNGKCKHFHCFPKAIINCEPTESMHTSFNFIFEIT